jgi:hypothetical protein
MLTLCGVGILSTKPSNGREARNGTSPGIGPSGRSFIAPGGALQDLGILFVSARLRPSGQRSFLASRMRGRILTFQANPLEGSDA